METKLIKKYKWNVTNFSLCYIFDWVCSEFSAECCTLLCIREVRCARPRLLISCSFCYFQVKLFCFRVLCHSFLATLGKALEPQIITFYSFLSLFCSHFSTFISPKIVFFSFLLATLSHSFFCLIRGSQILVLIFLRSRAPPFRWTHEINGKDLFIHRDSKVG